jgi:PAS domain S-box-containing protein
MLVAGSVLIGWGHDAARVRACLDAIDGGQKLGEAERLPQKASGLQLLSDVFGGAVYGEHEHGYGTQARDLCAAPRRCSSKLAGDAVSLASATPLTFLTVSEAMPRVRTASTAVHRIVSFVRASGMDGFEVAHHLKEVERTRDIPILFLTAVATDVQQIYRAYEVGAVDYIVKPLDPEVVRKKVAVFVDWVRQRRQIERQAAVLREADRRQYELELAELRVAGDRRYRKLVEGIDHAIGWTTDETLRFTFVSRRASRILGYSLDQFLEPGFWAAHLHAEDCEAVLGMFGRALAEGLELVANHRMIAADGRARRSHLGRERARRRDDVLFHHSAGSRRGARGERFGYALRGRPWATSLSSSVTAAMSMGFFMWRSNPASNARSRSSG